MKLPSQRARLLGRRAAVGAAVVALSAAAGLEATHGQDAGDRLLRSAPRTRVGSLGSGSGNATVSSRGQQSGGTGGTNGTVVFGGTRYTVGPVVLPTTSVPEAEEHVAVDPANASALVASISDFSLRGGSNTTKVAASSDGGTTWQEAFVPLANGQPATGDGLVWPYNSDPVVAIDRAGNVFLADLYFHDETNDKANGVYVAVGSFVSGGTPGFTIAHTYAVAAQLDPATSVTEDKEWIAADTSSAATSGNVYVSWTRFVGSSSDMVLFSRSTDHGVTWSAPLQVSLASQDGSVQGSQVAVGPSGEVYVAYEAFYSGGLRRQYLAKSTDGGATFTTAAPITPLFNELSFSSTYRKNTFCALAVSPVDGSVHALYADQPGKLGAEVEYVRSTDGGATFSAPLRLDDVSTGQQFMPALAVDEFGVLHASWFDTRNAGGSTSSYDIYATRSLDGGTTFAPNARVTPSLLSAGRSSFLGDYAGIAAGGHAAHPVWTTGANGRLATATLD